VLDAPRELGDVVFYAVWHPRVDNDPSHTWLRDVVRSAARPGRRAAKDRTRAADRSG
jgi:hypothetical protein